MEAASIVVKRARQGNVVDTAVVSPAINPFAFICYKKMKITKGGYLWGFIEIALIEGKVGDLKGENLGFIGTGLLLEDVNDKEITLRRRKPGRKLYSEFKRNKENTWDGIPSSKKR